MDAVYINVQGIAKNTTMDTIADDGLCRTAGAVLRRYFAAGSGLLRLDCNGCRVGLRPSVVGYVGVIVLKNPTTRSGCWNG